jgi:hypothetical protein
MADKPVTTDESRLQRGLTSIWERIAPLSVGSVVGSTAIIAASAVLRRALGPRARILGWAGTIVVLPLGIWALSRIDEREKLEARAAEAELPPAAGDTKELENP